MRAMIIALSIITLILVGGTVALWLLPTLGLSSNKPQDLRFGVHEGLELVGKVDKWGNESYSVEDGNGNRLFKIPVRNCMLDVRFRDGKLHFRENATGREGHIDTKGAVIFYTNDSDTPQETENKAATLQANVTATPVKEERREAAQGLDLKALAADNPFYKEAAKVLAGKLAEDDAQSRRQILNYCEHLRTAYTTKDIDFIKQVFSEQALIIVGNVVKPRPSAEGRFLDGDRVEYNIRTKKEYVARLQKAFEQNKKIDVRFSDFRILRHPTMDGIYGVCLRQRYKSDRYKDDGYLFLLWDFRDKSMPQIHVRTWQPAATVSGDNEVITLRDFNLG